MSIQFFEGPIPDGVLLDTVEMAAVPQIGATIAFDIDGDRLRHLKVISVQRDIEVRTRELTIESREVLIRCGTAQA